MEFCWGEIVEIPYERQKRLVELDDYERKELETISTFQAKAILLADKGLRAKEISARLELDYSKVIWILGSFRKRRMDYIRNAREMRPSQSIPLEVKKVMAENKETISRLSTPGELMRFLESKNIKITANLAKNIIYKLQPGDNW